MFITVIMVDSLWFQTGFTPKAPGTYMFYGSEFFMTLDLSVSDVQKAFRLLSLSVIFIRHV